MAWKINKLNIENFKFFLNPFPFKPEGKNVLLYGENGSGKSSIYWALFTHFQSSLKSLDQASKYFQIGHSENLRNLYDTQNKRSGIEVEFIDEAGVTKGYTDGSWSINTNADDFMKLTTFACDFMNYKFLSAIFDFKNSKPVELFDIFEEEIFPFVHFNQECIDIEGTPTGQTGADYWWKYILDCYKTPEMIHTRNGAGKVYVQDDVYLAYQSLINSFNERLRTLLHELENDTNVKLRDKFHVPVKVKLELRELAFNKKVEGMQRVYDAKFYKPQIILKANILDAAGNPVAGADIEHPRSFFNEAKLTSMALALRLSVFDRKYQMDDCARVIFVDDLLISLDMSNRLVVVQALLDYTTRYQLFIFTHDKAFFELVKDSISQRNTTRDWKFFDMYAIDQEVGENRVPEPYLKPEPCIKEDLDYVKQSKMFFSDCSFHASANSLRKECEKQLSRLYPRLWTLHPCNDGTISKMNLNMLDQKLEKFYEYIGMNNNPTPFIDQYRKRLLNPLSHDDDQSYIFRSELKIAIEEISRLREIQKKKLVESSEVGSLEFELTISKEANTVSLDFVYLDMPLRYSYNGQTYYGNTMVRVINIVGMPLTKTEDEIKTIIKKVSHHLGIPADQTPHLEDVIKAKATGILLRDM